MKKRSAVLMAAGLVGSLVIGVMAFALGALGPAPSAATPKLQGRRQQPAHTKQRGAPQASAPAASVGWTVVNAAPAPAPVPATDPNPSGSGSEGGSQPSDDPSPQPSGSPEPSPAPEPAPAPAPEPAPAPTPAPTQTQTPSPAPAPEPGDD